MNVRYRVELSEPEREELKEMIGGGKQSVRRLKRAQILLASDAGEGEEAISRTLRVGDLDGVPNATPFGGGESAGSLE